MRTSCIVRRTLLLAMNIERSFTVRFPEICLDYYLLFFPHSFFPLCRHSHCFSFLFPGISQPALCRDSSRALLGGATWQHLDVRASFQAAKGFFLHLRKRRSKQTGGAALVFRLGLYFQKCSQGGAQRKTDEGMGRRGHQALASSRYVARF